VKKRSQYQLLNAVLNTMSEVMYLQDREHHIIHMNEAGYRYFGCRSQDIIGKKCYSLFDLQAPCLNCPCEEVFQTKQPLRKDFFHTEHGKWLSMSVSPALDDNGELNELLVLFKDITSQKLHEKITDTYGQEMKLLVNRMPLGCITWDKDFKVAHWNKAAEKIFGYPEAEAFGKHPYDIIVPQEMIPKTDAVKAKLMAGDETAHRRGKNRTKTGQEIICDWTNTPLRDETGQVRGVLSVVQDVTHEVRNADLLTYQATHDSLTALPNRHWFKALLDQRLAEAKNKGEKFAIALMDLNKFKEINDTLGHQAGDQVLKDLAARFKKKLANIEVARLGGDEFVFLLPAYDDGDEICQLAQRIIDLFSAPFHVMGLEITISTSLGISCYPEHGDSESELLRKADVAMYLAKGDIHDIRFYEKSQDLHSQEQLQLMSELHYAISNAQLMMVYQPKIALDNFRLVGYEALVRWNHPDKGRIPPNRFIPYAENSDIVAPLTQVIFTMCIRQWRKLADAGRPIPIAVNLSPRMLLDQGLPDLLQELFAEYAIPPGALEIELTETAIIADPNSAGKVLRRIVDLGISISIDDYGTGYSSLTLLNKLPIEALKIDMSFVQNMLCSEQDRIIIKSTVELAHGLGLNVIAEGVENQETLHVLRLLGCDQAQGYLISRPLPAAHIMKNTVPQFSALDQRATYAPAR